MDTGSDAGVTIAGTVARRLPAALRPPRPGLRPWAMPGAGARHRRAWRARLDAAPVVTGAEHAAAVGLRDIERVAPCDLCGGDRFRDLFEVHAGKRRQARYHVVACDGCGLLQRQPGVQPERLGELYSGGSYGRFLDGGYSKARRRRYRLVMQGFGREFRRGDGRRLLDVGCGSGLFLGMAAERGFDAWGVDLSADAVERARAHGLQAFHGSPEDVPEIAAGGFDVITLWSVLAHLAEPVADVSRLRELLAPGGVLLALTVNAESLLLKRDGPEWNGFTPNHLQFYSPTTLKRLMESAGFASVEQPPLLPDGVLTGKAPLSKGQEQRLRREIERHNNGNMQRVLARNGAIPARGR